MNYHNDLLLSRLFQFRIDNNGLKLIYPVSENVLKRLITDPRIDFKDFLFNKMGWSNINFHLIDVIFSVLNQKDLLDFIDNSIRTRQIDREEDFNFLFYLVEKYLERGGNFKDINSKNLDRESMNVYKQLQETYDPKTRLIKLLQESNLSDAKYLNLIQNFTRE